MQRFTIEEIYALDKKGKHIGGIIEPVYPDYWLDSTAEEPGKAYFLLWLAAVGNWSAPTAFAW